MNRDDRYLRGIAHFNKREYFDAHEVWEDLWHEEHGEANAFIQGLIQFATALHHFEAHNLKGAKLLYEAGIDLLKPFGDVYWELPVKKLMGQMTECLKEVLPYKQSELPGRYHPGKENFPVQIDPQKIPKIQLLNENPHD